VWETGFVAHNFLRIGVLDVGIGEFSTDHTQLLNVREGVVVDGVTGFVPGQSTHPHALLLLFFSYKKSDSF
jgi:hypothetical protein